MIQFSRNTDDINSFSEVTLDAIYTAEEASTGLADWLIKDGLVVTSDDVTIFATQDWEFVPTVLQMTVLGSANEPRTFASDGSELSDNFGVSSSQNRYGVNRYKDSNQSFDIAQKFTTGDSVNGYEFTGVDLVVRDIQAGEQLVVHLHEGQGRSRPGARLATLESAETNLSVARTGFPPRSIRSSSRTLSTSWWSRRRRGPTTTRGRICTWRRPLTRRPGTGDRRLDVRRTSAARRDLRGYCYWRVL